MKIDGKTDIGLERSSNQDGFRMGILSENSAYYAVVCDGMGGANGGNIASDMALSVISEDIINNYREDMSSSSVKLLLKTSVFNANTRIYEKSLEETSLYGMGTTVVALLIIGDTAHFAHVGDSRAYIINNKITQITKDHSVVQTLIEKGKLSQTQARVHPDKNIITRALGVDDTVVIDYNELDITPDDTLLMCTDGLTNFVEDSVIFDLVKKMNEDVDASVLIDKANQNGGGDNITAVLLH